MHGESGLDLLTHSPTTSLLTLRRPTRKRSLETEGDQLQLTVFSRAMKGREDRWRNCCSERQKSEQI